MPGWKDLLKCLQEENLSPQEIMARLNVTPSRLRKMMYSKRLASTMNALGLLGEQKTETMLGASAVAAASRLAAAIASDHPRTAESARKACLDILETAKQIHISQQNRWSPPMKGYRRLCGA